MVNSSDFAKRLQKILDHYGVSATAFSERIAFNRSTISHLLSGRNKPSLEFVMKVLQEFPEVELYWLLNGKGTFPSEKKETSSTPISEEKEKTAPQTQLFEKSEISDKSVEIPSKLKSGSISKEIERIVIFFKDGSFTSYDS